MCTVLFSCEKKKRSESIRKARKFVCIYMKKNISKPPHIGVLRFKKPKAQNNPSLVRSTGPDFSPLFAILPRQHIHTEKLRPRVRGVSHNPLSNRAPLEAR